MYGTAPSPMIQCMLCVSAIAKKNGDNGNDGVPEGSSWFCVSRSARVSVFSGIEKDGHLEDQFQRTQIRARIA